MGQPDWYRDGHARAVTRVRATLSEERFAAAYAEGRTLSHDAAVALALAQVVATERQ